MDESTSCWLPQAAGQKRSYKLPAFGHVVLRFGILISGLPQVSALIAPAIFADTLQPEENPWSQVQVFEILWTRWSARTQQGDVADAGIGSRCGVDRTGFADRCQPSVIRMSLSLEPVARRVNGCHLCVVRRLVGLSDDVVRE